MTRQEQVQNLAKIARISVSYAEDLYDSFFPKPVVPHYIADYIEKVKSEGDLTVVGAVNEAPDGPIGDWLFCERVDTFAKAWVIGYEVEKEPRYTVQIKGVGRYHSYLNCNESRSIWFLSDAKGYSAIHAHHTRKELEANGFGWVFDCPGVEVKEVE